MSQGRRTRGFTLLEMMTVVAIVGILASLAGMAFVGVAKVARANGGATALARVLTSTRMRALTERCPYFVQINGPQFNPATAPADVLRSPGQALVYRKGNCDSTVTWYESGATLASRDKLVNQVYLTEFASIFNITPAGVVTGNVLGSGSLTIHYNALGQRTVSADNDADGTSTNSGVSTDLTIEVVATPGDPGDPRRSVVVPSAGVARAP